MSGTPGARRLGFNVARWQAQVDPAQVGVHAGGRGGRVGGLAPVGAQPGLGQAQASVSGWVAGGVSGWISGWALPCRSRSTRSS